MNDREIAFRVSGPLLSDQPPPWPGGPPHWQEVRRPPWQFGRRPAQGWQRWLRRPEQPFFLDPACHQGIVLGLCERGIDLSLLRLATNAARRSWKVIYFDALGSETQAATFLAAMYRAGCPRTRIFPHEPYDGWRGTPQQVLERLLQVSAFREPYYQYITTVCLSAILDGTKIASMDELVRRLADLSQKRRSGWLAASPPLPRFLPTVPLADVEGPALRYGALGTLVGRSLDGTWSFEDADAAYFSFNAWSSPQRARSLAAFLLADLSGSLTERASGSNHVLLLIKRPDLLFDLQQLAALFARMEHAGGSVFVAVRSTADLGSQAAHLLSSASTLLVHRSSSAAPFEPSVDLPWWGRHSSFKRTIRRLPDDECFVIHQGRLTHVRIDPVESSTTEVLRAYAGMPPLQHKPQAHATWGASFPAALSPWHVPPSDFDSPYTFFDPDAPDELVLSDGTRLPSLLFDEQGCKQQEERQEQGASGTSMPTAQATPSSHRPPRVRSRRSTRKKKGCDHASESDNGPVDF
jgi:hypothetical protein